MVKEQNDALSPDEYVLRRIPRDWCNPSLDEPVQRVGFQPNKRDNNGISMFREFFVSPAQVANAGGKGPTGYYVVRLRAADVIAVGLHIVPDPQDDQPPGHALIPELSFQAMKKDKEKSKELQRRLAKLAGNGIAFSPTH